MGWLSIFKRKPKVLDKWEVAESQSDPVLGEVWAMGGSNPFRDDHSYVEIRGVRDGWVQYYYCGTSGPYSLNEKKIRSFKWIYKRVESVNTKELDA